MLILQTCIATVGSYKKSSVLTSLNLGIAGLTGGNHRARIYVWYVQSQINKAFQIPRRDTLFHKSKTRNTDRPVFVTTYNPSLPNLNYVIKEYYPNSNSDPVCHLLIFFVFVRECFFLFQLIESHLMKIYLLFFF